MRVELQVHKQRIRRSFISTKDTRQKQIRLIVDSPGVISFKQSALWKCDLLMYLHCIWYQSHFRQCSFAEQHIGRSNEDRDPNI